MKLKNPIPKGQRYNYVRCVDLPEGYRLSGNVLFNVKEQQRLQYYAKPSIHTDTRFSESAPMLIGPKTLKAAVRQLNKLVGVNKGMQFTTFPGDVIYTAPKDVPGPVFEVNDPTLTVPTFDALGEALRREGWHVAINIQGSGGRNAIAYGNGKVAGWTEGNALLWDWYDGDNVLWDRLGEFDKWSRCEKIPKATMWQEINATLNDNI